MTINIQAIHFRIRGSLKKFIEEKVMRLLKLNQNIQNCQVHLKSEPMQKTVELKLSLPGLTLFTIGKAAVFETAVASSTEKMRRQLEKRHPNKHSHSQRL